jgi:type II secretion system protein J
MRILPAHRSGLPAFTLIELLLAITISAVILAAVNAVLFGALRLRNRSSRMLEDSVVRQQAFSILKRDLAGIVIPGGETNLAGALVYGGLTAVNDPAGTGMQLFTSTGIVGASAPWGEIQKVGYALRQPTNNAPALGRDLWRVITRNLLPPLNATFEEQLLLSDVERFDLSFFDGSTWRTSWGGTNETVPLPRAIRVDLVVAESDPAERSRGMMAKRSLVPFQLIVPVLVTASTNQTDSTDGGQP